MKIRPQTSKLSTKHHVRVNAFRITRCARQYNIIFFLNRTTEKITYYILFLFLVNYRKIDEENIIMISLSLSLFFFVI